MGGKHLKKLRAEKSKIHLKKKKLPKGQNITDTTFKVKKILTVEQLKKVNKDEPVSNWNVPMKDLLIRLNHYNFSSRLNGLCGIKELLTNYPEVLQGPSLKCLVSRLLDLITDEEHKIRTTAMDLLSYLFDLIPASAICPFHDMLCAHLGCAMTHRDASVQLDSLNFIDVMIKHAPEALKHNFWSIAQNFIRILKKFLNESHGMSLGGSKQDLEKSKTEMFLRFYQYIVTVYCSPTTVANRYLFKSIDVSSLGGRKISLRQSNDQYKKIPDLSLLFVNSSGKNTTLNQNDYEEFQSICSLIMPLLFDTWIEFCPGRKFNGATFECVLTEGIASLLCIILKIIMFLYERAVALEPRHMECRFVAAHGPTFKKCFTSSFPYLPTFTRTKSNPSRAGEFVSPCSGSCILQNLIICYLSYSFKLVPENSDLGTLMENYISLKPHRWPSVKKNLKVSSSELFAVQFLAARCDGYETSTDRVDIFSPTQFFQTGVLTRKNPAETEVLSKVVEAVIYTSNGENTDRILRKLVGACDATGNPELRRELSKALAKIVLDENESTWQKEQCVTSWMKSLPGHIFQTPVSREVIETISQLVNRAAGTEVLEEVEDKAFEILDILPDLKTDGIPEFEGQKMIANILFRCNNKVLEELLKKEVLLSSGPHSEKLRDYIKKIFHFKLMAPRSELRP